jgi:hypothetical protein
MRVLSPPQQVQDEAPSGSMFIDGFSADLDGDGSEDTVWTYETPSGSYGVIALVSGTVDSRTRESNGVRVSLDDLTGDDVVDLTITWTELEVTVEHYQWREHHLELILQGEGD